MERIKIFKTALNRYARNVQPKHPHVDLCWSTEHAQKATM